MKKSLVLLAVLLFGCVGGYAVYDRHQSVVQIDASLQELQGHLEQATTESTQYSEGLIKSLVATRIESIKAAMAMLRQKRSSLLHRIDLRYSINTGPYTPLNQDQSAILQSDIEDAEKQISEARKEAERYQGGLLKVLILSRVETEQLTLAGLRQRSLLDRHGIPWRFAPVDETQKPVDQPTVPDDEAL